MLTCGYSFINTYLIASHWCLDICSTSTMSEFNDSWKCKDSVAYSRWSSADIKKASPCFNTDLEVWQALAFCVVHLEVLQLSWSTPETPPRGFLGGTPVAVQKVPMVSKQLLPQSRERRGNSSHSRCPAYERSRHSPETSAVSSSPELAWISQLAINYVILWVPFHHWLTLWLNN